MKTKTNTTTKNYESIKIDEVITENIVKLYITAINNAKVITRIKRDGISRDASYNYLNEIDACLKSAHITESGYILTHRITGIEEDSKDIVGNALSVILENIGNIYTEDIRRKSRNAAAQEIYKLSKTKKDRAVLSLDDPKVIVSTNGGVPSWNDTICHDIAIKSIIDGMRETTMDEKDVQILDYVINGVSMDVIANIIGIHKSNVSRRYKKIIDEIKTELAKIECN